MKNITKILDYNEKILKLYFYIFFYFILKEDKLKHKICFFNISLIIYLYYIGLNKTIIMLLIFRIEYSFRKKYL